MGRERLARSFRSYADAVQLSTRKITAHKKERLLPAVPCLVWLGILLSACSLVAADAAPRRTRRNAIEVGSHQVGLHQELATRALVEELDPTRSTNPTKRSETTRGYGRTQAARSDLANSPERSGEQHCDCQLGLGSYLLGLPPLPLEPDSPFQRPVRTLVPPPEINHSHAAVTVTQPFVSSKRGMAFHRWPSQTRPTEWFVETVPPHLS